MDRPPPVIDPADRISRLPEGVQAHILSFLPAQEATRTCVLARAWRDVWKITRRLLIMGHSVQEARQFVDRLLRIRLDGLHFASIDTSEIRFDPFDFGYNRYDEDDGPHCLDEEDTSIVNAWICRLLFSQIKMLRIDISAFVEPDACWMEVKNKLLISRHLTRLELTSIGFTGCCLNFDRCPALEHLEINMCSLSRVTKMASLSLRHLVIASCSSYGDGNRIQICVPRLVSLLLDGDMDFRTPLLERMPELVEAKVQINS